MVIHMQPQLEDFPGLCTSHGRESQILSENDAVIRQSTLGKLVFFILHLNFDRLLWLGGYWQLRKSISLK